MCFQGKHLLIYHFTKEKKKTVILNTYQLQVMFSNVVQVVQEEETSLLQCSLMDQEGVLMEEVLVVGSLTALTPSSN